MSRHHLNLKFDALEVPHWERDSEHPSPPSQVTIPGWPVTRYRPVLLSTRARGDGTSTPAGATPRARARAGPASALAAAVRVATPSLTSRQRRAPRRVPACGQPAGPYPALSEAPAGAAAGTRMAAAVRGPQAPTPGFRPRTQKNEPQAAACGLSCSGPPVTAAMDWPDSG
jgi:hypothetical protein